MKHYFNGLLRLALGKSCNDKSPIPSLRGSKATEAIHISASLRDFATLSKVAKSWQSITKNYKKALFDTLCLWIATRILTDSLAMTTRLTVIARIYEVDSWQSINKKGN